MISFNNLSIIQDAYSEIDEQEKQKIDDEALMGSKFEEIHS